MKTFNSFKNAEERQAAINKVEDQIDRKIEEERELYELEVDDINDIRLAIYLENGWDKDPFPIDEEDRIAYFPEDECGKCYGAEDFSGCGMGAAEFAWRYQM